MLKRGLVFPTPPEDERQVEVRFGTDLTFFIPDTLKVVLSEDDFGGDTHDELWFFVDTGAGDDPIDPTTNCDSCSGGAGNYQYLGEVAEGGPQKGLNKLGTRAYTVNLQPNFYSEAEPGSFDTDEEYYVPIGGGAHAHDVPFPPPQLQGFFGLRTLDEDQANTPDDSAHFVYSDHPTGDQDEADYYAIMRYCLLHEWVEPAEAGQTLVQACRKWTSEGWGN